MAVRLLVLGIVIGSNNLAVALALGSLGQTIRVRRIVSVFGLLEFVVPLFGLLIGRGLAVTISESVAFISPILLAGVGAATLLVAFRGRIDAESLARRITSYRGLALLGLILSVDNLVLGFGLGLQGDSPLLVAADIALFSMLFTWIGLKTGDKVRILEPVARYGAGILLLFFSAYEWLG
jgi:manganese efflux pump family protein